MQLIELVKLKKIQPEKNNIEAILTYAVNKNNNNNISDLNNDLKEILIRFLNTFYRFYFSPLRIQKWGSKQLDFKFLGNYSTTEIKDELENLLKTNMVKRL